MQKKICSKCEQEKFIRSFWRQAHGFLGRDAYCKKCRGNYNQQSYRVKKKQDPLYGRSRKLRKAFNLTVGEYSAKAEAQQNLCAICHQPETVFGRNRNRPMLLSVDHNHATGQNRGLLCSNCNRGLGMFAESGARLQSAIEYLKLYDFSK
jgi:Autographiviridae endonuclease VII